MMTVIPLSMYPPAASSAADAADMTLLVSVSSSSTEVCLLDETLDSIVLSSVTLVLQHNLHAVSKADIITKGVLLQKHFVILHLPVEFA